MLYFNHYIINNLLIKRNIWDYFYFYKSFYIIFLCKSRLISLQWWKAFIPYIHWHIEKMVAYEYLAYGKSFTRETKEWVICACLVYLSFTNQFHSYHGLDHIDKRISVFDALDMINIIVSLTSEDYEFRHFKHKCIRGDRKQAKGKYIRTLSLLHSTLMWSADKTGWHRTENQLL